MPLFCALAANAQDSTKAEWLRKQQPDNRTDSAKHADSLRITAAKSDSVPAAPTLHSPRKAAFYSAVLPGLGQAYNREYWKIPLVYAALGITTYTFIFNFNEYTTFRNVYRVRIASGGLVPDDYPYYSDDAIKSIRDTYRQYVDYSVLVFVLAYSLNIVDATVFAHLRNFDMSDDLSMKVRPAIINNQGIGLSLQINLGKRKKSFSNSLAISK